jgi:hypothetical protein
MDSPLGQLLACKWKAGCAREIPGPFSLDINSAGNHKPNRSYRPYDQHAGNQKADDGKRPGIPCSDNRTTAKCYIDLYETILQRPLVALENQTDGLLDKKSRTKASDVQVIPYPKTNSTKPYPLLNEWVSAPAMAPI